jgi:hypothetical protein
MQKDIVNAIRNRTSIRTYKEISLSDEHKGMIENFIKNEINKTIMSNIRFEIIDIEDEEFENTKKLSSYGIIKGAKTYIACIIKKNASIVDLGYAFEQVVLFATNNNIGTCWMGGTFNRSAFSIAAGLKEDEILPIISPLGYEAEKPSRLSLIMRYLAKSDKRLPFEELYFKNDAFKPFDKEKSGKIAEVLELARIAPSASNKQPWRVVRDSEGDYNFYIERTKNYSGNALGYDIQLLDIGITMCHFDLSTKEIGIKGSFKKLDKEDINFKESRIFEYVSTFKTESKV